MAFKKLNEMKILLLLVLTSVPLIVSTHIDCAGRSFHCVNNTHFMICVDLGGGVSMTVDEFTIPCPPSTACHHSNRFECEFEAPSPAPTTRTSASEVTNELSANTKPWEEIEVSSIPNINTRDSAYFDLSTFSITEANTLTNTTLEVNNENKTGNDVSSISPTHKEVNDSTLNTTKYSIVDETETIDEALFLSENSEPVIKPSVGLEVSTTNPVESFNTSSSLTGLDSEIETIITNISVSNTTTSTIQPSASELNQTTVVKSSVMNTDILNDLISTESPDIGKTEQIEMNKNNLTTPQDLNSSTKKTVNDDSVNNGIKDTPNISTAENTMIDVTVYNENNITGDAVNNKIMDALNVSTVENTVNNVSVFNRIKDTQNTSIADKNITGDAVKSEIKDLINTTTANYTVTKVSVYNKNNITEDGVHNEMKNALNPFITEKSLTDVLLNNEIKEVLMASTPKNTVFVPVVKSIVKDRLRTSIDEKNLTGDEVKNVQNTTYSDNTVTEIPIHNESYMIGDTVNNVTKDALNTSVTDRSVTEVAVNNEMKGALNTPAPETSVTGVPVFNRIKDRLSTSIAENTVTEVPVYITTSSAEWSVTEIAVNNEMENAMNASSAKNTVTDVQVFSTINNTQNISFADKNITGDEVKNEIMDVINIAGNTVTEDPVYDESNTTEVALSNETKDANIAPTAKNIVTGVLVFDRITDTINTSIAENNVTGDAVKKKLKDVQNTITADNTVTEVPVNNGNNVTKNTVNNETKDALNTSLAEIIVNEFAGKNDMKDDLNASAAKISVTNISIAENDIKDLLNTTTAENTVIEVLVYNKTNTTEDGLNNEMKNVLNTSISENSVTEVAVNNVMKDAFDVSIIENTVTGIPDFNRIKDTPHTSIAEYTITEDVAKNNMKDASNTTTGDNTMTEVPVYNEITNSIVNLTTTGRPKTLNPIPTTESVDLLNNNLNELESLSTLPTSELLNILETTTVTSNNYMTLTNDHNLEDTSLTEITESNYTSNNNISTNSLDQIPITNATSQYETTTNYYLINQTQNKSELKFTETQITNIVSGSNNANQNIKTIETPISTLAIENTYMTESDQSAVLNTGMHLNNEAIENSNTSALLEITEKSLSDVISNRISNKITDTNNTLITENIPKPGSVTSESASLVTEKVLHDTIISKTSDTSTADAEINLIASQPTILLDTHVFNPTLEQTASSPTIDNIATEPSQAFGNITAIVNNKPNYTSTLPELQIGMVSTDNVIPVNKITSTESSQIISNTTQNTNSANSIISGVHMSTDSSLQNVINAELITRQGNALEKPPIVTANHVATKYQNNIGSINTVNVTEMSKTTIGNSGTDVTPQNNTITLDKKPNIINMDSSIPLKKTDKPNLISTPNTADNFEITTTVIIDNISGSNSTNVNESQIHSKLVPNVNITLHNVNGNNPTDNIVNLVINSSVPPFEEYNVNKLNSLHPTQSNIFNPIKPNEKLNTAFANNEKTPLLQKSNFNNTTSVTKPNELTLSTETLVKTSQNESKTVSTISNIDYTAGISAINILPDMIESETKLTLIPNVKLQNGLKRLQLKKDETKKSIQNPTIQFEYYERSSTPANTQRTNSSLSVSNDSQIVLNTATSLANPFQNVQTTVSEKYNNYTSDLKTVEVTTSTDSQIRLNSTGAQSLLSTSKSSYMSNNNNIFYLNSGISSTSNNVEDKTVSNKTTTLKNNMKRITHAQSTVDNGNNGTSSNQIIAVTTKPTATTSTIEQSTNTIIINVQNQVNDIYTEKIRSTTLKTILASGSSTDYGDGKFNNMGSDVNHKITSNVTSIQDLNNVLQIQTVNKQINSTNGLNRFIRMPSISVQDKTIIVDPRLNQNGDIVNRGMETTNKISIITSTSKTTKVVLDDKQKETNVTHSEALDLTSLPSTDTETSNMQVALQDTSNSKILNNYLVSQQNIDSSILSSNVTDNVEDILHVNRHTQKSTPILPSGNAGQMTLSSNQYNKTLNINNNSMQTSLRSDLNSSGANNVSQPDSLHILDKLPDRRIIGHGNILNTTQSKQSLNILDNNKPLNSISVPESKSDTSNSINIIIQPLALVNPRNSTNNQHFDNSQKLHNMKQQFNCLNRQRGKYGDNDDYRKFYICFGHMQPIVGECPVNTVFSEIRKQCTRNLSHCIRNNEFKCTKQERFIDLTRDNTYYICAKNSHGTFTRFKFQCQKEYTLDKSIIQCVHNADNSNQSVSSKGSESKTETKHSTFRQSGMKSRNKKRIKNKSFECEAEGKYPVSGKCREYYVCSLNNKSEFRRRMKTCDSDEVFDKDKNKCVDADSYEC